MTRPALDAGLATGNANGTGSVMRRSNWAGVFSVAVAVGTAFFAGQAIGRREVGSFQFGDTSEASNAPPLQTDESSSLTPPQLVDDLACPATLQFTLTSQSIEPPLADGAAGPIRLTGFQMPAAGDQFGPMPYLTDDPAPAFLPHLTDVSDLAATSAPDPDNPLLRAVRKFVNDATQSTPPAGNSDKR